MFNLIRSLLTPAPAPTLSELAHGTCALPDPPQAVKVPKAAKPVDAFVERAETNTWGFREVSGRIIKEGSVPELTNEDVSALIDRDCWGKKPVQDLNFKCKQLWYEGHNVSDAAKLLKRSPSWVEKRFGAFSSALPVEGV